MTTYIFMVILGIIAGILIWGTIYNLSKKNKSKSLDLNMDLINNTRVILKKVSTTTTAPFRPSRYLPITKGFIIKRCGLSPLDFKSIFIDNNTEIPGWKKCIQEQLDEITTDYRKSNWIPIYLMCTKKALAAHLGITTTKLNNYFKGEGDNLNIQIEELLNYDDQWAISRLILPS